MNIHKIVVDNYEIMNYHKFVLEIERTKNASTRVAFTIFAGAFIIIATFVGVKYENSYFEERRLI
jgi:hypothetical protein